MCRGDACHGGEFVHGWRAGFGGGLVGELGGFAGKFCGGWFGLVGGAVVLAVRGHWGMDCRFAVAPRNDGVGSSLPAKRGNPLVALLAAHAIQNK